MAESVAKICDPGRHSLAEAIQMAKDSSDAAPGLEIELVRYLQAQCLSKHVPLPTVFRGLEVLGGIFGGGKAVGDKPGGASPGGASLDEGRLVTLLRPFLRSSDPQIASKCVLVLGRQSSSMTW